MPPKPRRSIAKKPATGLMRLVPSNPVVQLLRSRLESGEISKKEKPSVAHKSDPLFSQYDLARFRTCFNNLRDELFTDGK